MHHRPLPLLVLLSCGSGADPAAPIDAPAAPRAIEPAPAYSEVLATLAEQREALATRYAAAADTGERAAVLDEARATVLDAITQQIVPAWYGTPWEFYGTTQTPGQGTIACGYFVSTVLQHAGFGVERVKMAQQASEHIVKTLAPADRIWRFRDRPVADVVRRVRAEGEGLYLIGLDWHVAMLHHDGERVWMCHSSYLGDAAVLCEDALASPAMVSRYHVVGELLREPMIVAWLEQRPIATVTR